MIGFPEPSINDHGAPWNEEDAEDEDGNEIIICGCSSCKRKRAKEARDFYEEERGE